MGIRSSIGLGIVCLVIVIIGTMLSISGRDRERMAHRVTYAEQGESKETLVEGTIVPFADARLRSPYGGQEAVAFRAWIDVEPEHAEPFRTADQQVIVPFGVEAKGERYRVDLESFKPRTIEQALWISPRKDRELLIGAPTFESSEGDARYREITLVVGERISILGTLSEDEEGQPGLGGRVQVFKGTPDDWREYGYQQAGGDKQGVRVFGLVLMGFGAIGGSLCLFFLLRGLWRMRSPTTEAATPPV